MNRMTDPELGEINLDELRQVLWQATDFKLIEDMAHDGAVDLYCWRDFKIDKVEGHFFVQELIGLNALEVDVKDLRFKGVHLKITQQHLLAFAVKFKVENGGVEGFNL